VALSNAWGTPYARDVAWVRNTGDSLYASVAASGGGVQLVRVPRAGGGSPSLVLSQQTLGPAIGLAGAWTGTIGAALGSSGVALLRAPGAAYLNRILPGAGAPYTAPVTLARLAPWAATGAALETAAHQTPASAASAARFGATAGPNPDLLVSDGGRVLVLRPGTAAITGVETEPPPTPPATHTVALRVTPNPLGKGPAVFEVRAEPLSGGSLEAAGSAAPVLGPLRLEIYDLNGRLVRTLELAGGTPVASVVWDGRNRAGRRLASGRYWARVATPTHPAAYVTEPFLILK
jgi:hypothetical protein